jgi:hypothetical protein
MQLEARDYSCRLWERLDGELQLMTLTDSAASVQPPRFATANFGVFAIERIEASLRGVDVQDRGESDDTCC